MSKLLSSVAPWIADTVADAILFGGAFDLDGNDNVRLGQVVQVFRQDATATETNGGRRQQQQDQSHSAAAAASAGRQSQEFTAADGALDDDIKTTTICCILSDRHYTIHLVVPQENSDSTTSRSSLSAASRYSSQVPLGVGSIVRVSGLRVATLADAVSANTNANTTTATASPNNNNAKANANTVCLLASRMDVLSDYTTGLVGQPDYVATAVRVKQAMEYVAAAAPTAAAAANGSGSSVNDDTRCATATQAPFSLQDHLHRQIPLGNLQDYIPWPPQQDLEAQQAAVDRWNGFFKTAMAQTDASFESAAVIASTRKEPTNGDDDDDKEGTAAATRQDDKGNQPLAIANHDRDDDDDDDETPDKATMSHRDPLKLLADVLTRFGQDSQSPEPQQQESQLTGGGNDEDDDNDQGLESQQQQQQQQEPLQSQQMLLPSDEDDEAEHGMRLETQQQQEPFGSDEKLVTDQDDDESRRGSFANGDLFPDIDKEMGLETQQQQQTPVERHSRGKHLRRLSVQYERQQHEQQQEEEQQQQLGEPTKAVTGSREEDGENDDDDENMGMGISKMLLPGSPEPTNPPQNNDDAQTRVFSRRLERRSVASKETVAIDQVRDTAAMNCTELDERHTEAEDGRKISSSSNRKRKQPSEDDAQLGNDTEEETQPTAPPPPPQRTIDRWLRLMGTGIRSTDKPRLGGILQRDR